jgi:hypothetical protein
MSSIPAFQSKSGSAIQQRPPVSNAPSTPASPPAVARSGGGGGGGSSSSENGEKKDRLRQEAVRELIQTELDYINDIELVNEVFLKPMLSRSVLDKQVSP